MELGRSCCGILGKMDKDEKVQLHLSLLLYCLLAYGFA